MATTAGRPWESWFATTLPLPQAISYTDSMALDALDYLAHSSKHPPLPVCVLYGDDAFLKRPLAARVQGPVLGAEGEFALTTFNGKDAELRRS